MCARAVLDERGPCSRHRAAEGRQCVSFCNPPTDPLRRGTVGAGIYKPAHAHRHVPPAGGPQPSGGLVEAAMSEALDVAERAAGPILRLCHEVDNLS